MARRGTASKKTISVNMTGVESGGGGFIIDDGNYPMKLTAAEKDRGDKGDMIVWDFKGLKGQAKGKSFRMWTSLVPEALWKLKGVLEALGVNVPDSTMDIDLDEIVESEAEVIGTVEVQEYQGKKRSKLIDISSGEEEEEEEEEEDDRPTKKGKPAAKKAAKLTADEVRAMDDDELQDIIDEHELEVDLGDFKTQRRKANAVVSALELD